MKKFKNRLQLKKKAVRKPRAKKVQEVPQAEVATPEKTSKT